MHVLSIHFLIIAITKVLFINNSNINYVFSNANMYIYVNINIFYFASFYIITNYENKLNKIKI